MKLSDLLAVKLSDLLAVQFPQPDDAVIAGAGNLSSARVPTDACWKLDQGSDYVWGCDGGAWLDLAGSAAAQVKDPDLLVGAASGNRVLIES